MQILDTHSLQMMTSRDPGETSGHLALFLFQYLVTPLEKCEYRARVGGLRLGAISFALIEFGASIRLEAAAHGDYYVMMSCLRGSGELCVDGQLIKASAGIGFFSRPCKHVSAQFSNDSVRLIVKIESALLDNARYRDLEQRFSLASPTMQPWFEQIQLLLSSQSLMQALESDRRLSSQMECLMSSLLRYGAPQQLGGVPQTHAVSRDVRLAEVFIGTHTGDDISLREIAAAANVSARTLQANFLRYRNTSPMEYLRAVRLDAVRNKLLFGGRGLLVTDVAIESGFRHLSRFSLSYRERFGELPSATLRRARRPKRQSNRTR
jgi:AraC-like DNA-binding protein